MPSWQSLAALQATDVRESVGVAKALQLGKLGLQPVLRRTFRAKDANRTHILMSSTEHGHMPACVA